MHIGTIMLLIGAAHVLLGAVIYSPQLSEIARAGVVASVPDFGDRAVAFWFIIAGALFALLGACLRELERRALPLPRVLAPGLCVLTALIVIPMPTSGGWLFAPLAWLAYRRTRRPAPWAVKP